MPTLFTDFPDQARVWAYAFDRPLNDTEAQTVCQHLDTFISEWATHGTPVRGAYELLHNQFVLIAAEEPQGGVSGCSIDSSVRIFKELQATHGLDALNRGLVFFQAKDVVHAMDRLNFKKAVQAGEVGSNTTVYDLTVQTVGDVKNEGFEKPFANSWHAKAFPLP